MNTADLADKAADIIIEEGLHKGYYVNPSAEKGCCTLGALALASGFPTTARPSFGRDLDLEAVEFGGPQWNSWRATHSALEEFLARKYQAPYLVSRWNDDPDRTQDDVVTTLREFAASLREAE